MKKQYRWLDEVLTPEECDEIIVHCSKFLVPGMYDKRNKQGELIMPWIPSLIRMNQICWVPQGSDIDHLMQKVVQIFLQEVQNFFYLPCTYVESIQFAKYGFLGHYSKHTDSSSIGRASRRIISASVQLSDSDSYKGGNLKIDIEHKMLKTPREQGTLTIFPSVFEHKVTPVLRGQRYALVLWAHIEEPPSQEETAKKGIDFIQSCGSLKTLRHES